MIVEKWWRSWLKVFTWRIIAILALGLVAIIATGSLAITGAILGVDIVIKSILYYIHERMWNRLSIGKDIEDHEGYVVWFTGLSGSGKTTLADEVAKRLKSKGIPVKRIDGDVARATFSSDLGFSKEDRDENNRRATYASSWGSRDSIVLSSFISPYQDQRNYARKMCKNFIEVFVDSPIETCEYRDVKGLYKKARSGEIKSFTGIHDDAPYEVPRLPDLRVDTCFTSLDESARKVIKFLKAKNIV